MVQERTHKILRKTKTNPGQDQKHNIRGGTQTIL